MTSSVSSKVLVVHCKKVKYDVYIGRAMPGMAGSPFANPFKIGEDGTRDEVLKKYEAYIRSRPDLLELLPSLEGKVLGCWCAPKKCHGDILVKLINELKVEQKFFIF